ncbi:hypothetical protein RSOLAG22IIIB_01059 [Rhizoctonia solani]|uniref:Uncharacterized protein n=1 Tax=Rhizoctonia solani TaxID=456999 RepID=A0A0K6G2D3_9AGAM|nr:hypothetical protein RSOLAG22IIIB_01059 [Rhizoctonia solani]
MAGQKRNADGAGASETRAAKAAKVSSKDGTTSKKPTSKASEKPASKSKATEKPASKAKTTEKPTSKSKPASKSEKAAPKSTGKAKATKKTPMSAEDFKAKALPLHVNLTQTPPKVEEPKDGSAPATSDDGFLGSIAMQPTTFQTGSYGWKGSRRLTIPLPGGAEGETVTVMININASVAGSKDAAAEAEKEDLAAAVKEDLVSGSDSD